LPVDFPPPLCYNTHMDDTTPAIIIPQHIGKVGRPPIITSEIAEAIIDDVSAGDSLPVIEVKYQISRKSIFYHMANNEVFYTAYKRARRTAAIAQVERLAHEGELLAAEADTAEDIRRVDVKTRIWSARDRSAQWYAERANPELYGAKQQLEVTVGQSPADLRAAAWAAREVAFEEQDPEPESPPADVDNSI